MSKKRLVSAPHKKSFFDPVEPRINFPKMEQEILKYWDNKGVVEKYLQKNQHAKKYFSFLDGPITANNPMGIHHAWGRTYKDLWQRYKNMQGFKQRFQNGFDAQGLWVEVEVEKELGFKNKKEIETYGVAKFVEKCKERVRKYSEIQTQQSKRLGYFMDWDNSYFTMSDENNYMIWHFLKVCHQNGWLYKGKESVPWCPRCQTAISQHEILTEDYKEVVHDSIYFTLPIVDRKDEFLLVWTTTPWTLPANIAVAIEKNLDYSLVDQSGLKYWLATKAVKNVISKGNHKIVKTVKGAELEGLKYEGPFDHLPAVKEVAQDNKETFHRVIATDSRIMPISPEEGTGLVHTAVSAGTEDFKLGKKYGLPMIPVIADSAQYLSGLGFLSGKNAKKHPEIIIDFLLKESEKPGVYWVYKIEKYKHRYPRCWRCKTELVWKVTDEWYIAMDRPSRKALNGKSSSQKHLNGKSNLTLRERMKIVARKIDWKPNFGLKRELDWLDNMHDWLISKKNRYWGLCLPIWECTKCNHFEVIGSKGELRKMAVKGWGQFVGKSPHKPYIDKIKIKCTQCDGLMSRIESVGNPWLDAGIVPFSTIAKGNTANPLYSQDKKEWRKWFPADFITESFPGQFKNWFYSMIAMSTVLEDEAPTKVILGFATLLDEKGRAMHKSWGNAIEFNEGADKIGVDVMRFLYARQNPSENLLFGYQKADEVRRMFVLKLWNIYNFFVTYAELDGWRPAEKHKFKTKKLDLLDQWIISRLNQTILSATTALNKHEAYQASAGLQDFLNDFSNWYIRRSRDRVGPTSASKVDSNQFYQTTHHTLITLMKLLAPFTPFVSEAIYRNLTKEESVHLADWPKAKGEIDEKLIEDMKKIRMVVEEAHSLRKEKGIPVRQPLSSLVSTLPFSLPRKSLSSYLMDEINVREWKVTKGTQFVNKLNTKITPELTKERKIRELIREIQRERKRLGINIIQAVEVSAPWLPERKSDLARVKKKTVAEKLTKGDFKVTVIGEEE